MFSTFKVFPFEFFFSVPELFLVFSLLFLLLFGVFAESTFGKVLTSRLILFYSSFSLFLLFFLYCNTFSALAILNLDFSYGMFAVDLFSLFFKLFLVLVSFFYFILIWPNRSIFFSFEFSLLLLFVLFGHLLLLSAVNFLTVYLALELSSLALYALAASRSFTFWSTEAGLKYFILGSFSSGLLLFGFSILYGVLGTFSFHEVSLLLLNPAPTDVSVFFGFGFILAGLLFKLSVAPFHFWVPDVYDGSPFIVTFFFAILTKIAVFALFLRLSYFSLYSLFEVYSSYLLIFGLLSVCLGTFGALQQNRFKRFVAYSGIVHSGYIILGISTGTGFGLFAACFYLFVYVLLNLNFFSLLLSLRRNRHDSLSNISELSNFVRSDPVTSAQLVLNLFSMAGIPPLAGFFSKFYIILALLWSGFYLSSLLVVLLSVASSVYYLRLIKITYFETFFRWSLQFPLPLSLTFFSLLTTFFNLFFVLMQPSLFSLITYLFNF